MSLNQVYRQDTSDTSNVLDQNLNACQELLSLVESGYGTSGLTKLVVTKHGANVLTKTAATILSELTIEQPAASVLKEYSLSQSKEHGDGSSQVVVLCGRLLQRLQNSLLDGMKPSKVADVLDDVLEKLLAQLDALKRTEKRTRAVLERIIRNILTPKFGYDAELGTMLLTEAVLCKEMRVHILPGGSFEDSQAIKGLLFFKSPSTRTNCVTASKVVVYTAPIRIPKPETKSTALFKNGSELMAFEKSEDDFLFKTVEALHKKGVRLVIAGDSVDERAIQFFDKFKIVCVKLQSKHDVRLACLAFDAKPITRFDAEITGLTGECKSLMTLELGSKSVIVMDTPVPVCSILLRGPIEAKLREAESVLNNTVRCLETERIQFGGEEVRILPDGYMKTLSEEMRREREGRPYNERCVYDAVSSVLAEMESYEYDMYGVRSSSIELAFCAASSILSVDRMIVRRAATDLKQNVHARDEN